MATPSATPLCLKFVFGDDIRRWSPPTRPPFCDLLAKARDMYGLSQDATVQFKYVDADGDKVVFQHLRRVFLELFVSFPSTYILASPPFTKPMRLPSFPLSLALSL